MITTALCQGDGLFNEDELIVNDEAKIYGVIDGVTSINGELIAGITPGKRASMCVKDVFEMARKDQTLDDVTVQANAQIAVEMDAFNIKINHPKDRFQCCHAVVKINEAHCDYTTSADCVIYTIGKSVKQIMPLMDKKLESDRVKMWQEKYPDAYKTNHRPQEMIDKMNEAKKCANIPGGYSVMNGDILFNSAFNKGSFSLNDLEYILITTDGFYDIEHLGLESFVRFAVEHGPEAFKDYMMTHELNDKEKKLYPRVKVHDDKACVLIDLTSQKN